MSAKRKIEIFSAGCPVCRETVDMVNRIACPSCEITILDMNNENMANHAKKIGISSVPAVIIDDKLANCCVQRGTDEATLRIAGLGKPI